MRGKTYKEYVLEVQREVEEKSDAIVQLFADENGKFTPQEVYSVLSVSLGAALAMSDDKSPGTVLLLEVLEAFGNAAMKAMVEQRMEKEK